ncbi:DUF6745 domain-containing protein [Kitasatospora sp. NPDC048540]|uniref:DUF6745 domain-containing protein n=1 Tax=Kitasatospora sp. NPDC048540 TaxID=3155634 RepID=UPI00340DBD4F
MMVQQQSAPREAVARWREVAAGTGPADRPAVERAVRAAYRAAGLAEPAAVVWFGSPQAAALGALALRGAAPEGLPLGGALAALEAAGVRAGGAVSVRERIRTAPWEAARQRLHAGLGALGWAELWSLTGGELGPQTGALAARIRDAVLDRLAPDPTDDEPPAARDAARTVRSAARLALLDGVLGPHDAAWLAAFDAAGALDGPHPLAPLAEIARGAGWWWPYEGVALVSERPVELHRDEAGRLDRADGPALAYPDGFALHAWRGMPVPPGFLAELAAVTPERIRTEENAELRRVMLEFYGYERYLADSGAEPLHRDATGVLWRIQLPDDEPVVMVEVVNSTAESDGTFRTYWLRVPPSTRTARAGVAWTFGVPEQEYRPQRET